MRRYHVLGFALLATTAVLSMDTATGGQPYPRVRTFSGNFYGPTQAHFQYQRQYGRPWHGHNGFWGGSSVGAVNGYPAFGGYGAVVGGWAFPSYGYGWNGGFFPVGVGFTNEVAYGVSPIWATGFGMPSPWSGFASPPFGVFSGMPTPPMNPVLSDAWEENLQQWEQPLEALPVLPSAKPALPESTPAAQLRSIQFQEQGDRRLRDSDYLRAAARFREAISAAPDRAEPHLHLAFAFAGMRQFDEAAKELKVGLTLDPTWASSGASLATVLGADNLLTKEQMKQRVAEWTLADTRDPDRLFLLGAMLYLDNDAERGRTILETAARLGGLHDYLAAFLNSQRGAIAAAPPVTREENAELEVERAAPDAELPLPELPPLPPVPNSNSVPPPPTPPPAPSPAAVPEATSVSRPIEAGPSFPE